MTKALKNRVFLREVRESDLDTFFEHQLDRDANYMAAFSAKDPTDREAFMAHWVKILADDSIIKMTILFQGDIAGHVASFERFGVREVTYWIGKHYWGKKIATRALSIFLSQFKTRPLHARVAKDNTASLRVLEKCGFIITGEDKAFSNARGEEVEEFLLKLSD